MDATTVKQVLDNVVTDVNMAADFAGMIDPALIPFIQIGKAVDKLIPGLAGKVANMGTGGPPAQEDLDQMAQELALLSDKSGI